MFSAQHSSRSSILWSATRVGLLTGYIHQDGTSTGNVRPYAAITQQELKTILQRVVRLQRAGKISK